MKFRNTGTRPLRFELDGEWFTATVGGEVTPEIPRKLAGCLPKGLPVEALEPLVQAVPEHAPARAARAAASAEAPVDPKTGRKVCQKCSALGYKPCSIECFVAAGYKAENYEKFVADCDKSRAEEQERDARSEDQPPQNPPADDPAKTETPAKTDAPPAEAAAADKAKGGKRGQSPVMS